MSKSIKLTVAHKLRKTGLSIGDIARRLSVSKSTSSLWCREIVLSVKQKQALKIKMIKAGHRGRMLGSQRNHEKKMGLIKHYREEASRLVGQLSEREWLIAGVMLYWAEGSRKDHKLSFINSDPALIVLMYQWFQTVFGISKERFMPRIFINEIHKSRINKVLKFWSVLLQLPVKQFGNPTFLKVKSKKRYDNHDQYYGTLALRIGNGGELKHRMMGLVEEMRSKYMSG
jgi:hypothetical protein